jgi:hypothetical protein
MKKMIKWFSVLQANDVELKLSPSAESTADDTEHGAVEVAAPTTETHDLEHQ